MSLYTPVHESFVRFCKAKSYGIMEYEDLINETVLRAFEDIDKLRNKKAFLSFLFGIASNIIKNILRSKNRMTYNSEYDDRVEDFSPSADTQYDIEILYRALNQLPETTKEALILFEISGFSIKEIAKIQDSGLSAVKQRLKRGRESLSEILGVSGLKEDKKLKKSQLLTAMFLL